MARVMSRRAAPDHPVLFTVAADIPSPPIVVHPPAPRAGLALEPFAAVLAAAEALELGHLDSRSVGRTVLVGGERRPAEALLVGDALLDDGSAVVPLVLAARSSSALRSALAARFVLVTGTVREIDGAVAIEPTEVADLRAIARDWARRR